LPSPVKVRFPDPTPIIVLSNPSVTFKVEVVPELTNLTLEPQFKDAVLE
jgi:hypothetical protein